MHQPDGWRECRDYQWFAGGADAPTHVVMAALAGLGLPEETPDEALPAELAPSDPPAHTLRD